MRNTSRKYTEDDHGMIDPGYAPKMKKSTQKNLQEYRTGYVREHYRQFGIKISRTKYPEVISHLEQQQNLSAYILDLIIKDMSDKG